MIGHENSPKSPAPAQREAHFVPTVIGCATMRLPAAVLVPIGNSVAFNPFNDTCDLIVATDDVVAGFA
jgi:hypothetical protein